LLLNDLSFNFNLKSFRIGIIILMICEFLIMLFTLFDE